MKKLFLSMAAVLLSSMAFAQSYTLNFVECEKTESDGSSVYSKGNSDAEYIANVFGETDKVASIVSRDNVYPARIGCGAKFGTSSKKGILAFTLATPTEVDSIVFSAAMYSKLKARMASRQSMYSLKIPLLSLSLQATKYLRIVYGNPQAW